jgi:hypothetical protein
MSTASSTVKSRVHALQLQVVEEKRRKDRVLKRIEAMQLGSEHDADTGVMPTASSLTLLQDSCIPAASTTRSVVRQADSTEPTKELSAFDVRLPPAQRKAPLPPPPKRVAVPSASRKPPLPPAARQTNSGRRDAALSLVGRRKATEPELYVARMRHEERMTLVRKFSLDL